ncbi:hypothetical protein BJ508DRAFT_371682 [Ascobolus immersus RN42]|uniref:Uncharacterized protein n=1 Tax=Ascobolus immersus RN42 TaxID=1160509 RepID=A0A3N4IPY1_ASCIM|nr:hypothetical protein BJ508DRAFT_371682 [Ascobolus immersus RN42]
MKRYTNVDDIPTPPIRPTTERGPTFDGLWKRSLKDFQEEKKIASRSNSVASSVIDADEKPPYDDSSVGRLSQTTINKVQENGKPTTGAGGGDGRTQPSRNASGESDTSLYTDCDDSFGGVLLCPGALDKSSQPLMEQSEKANCDEAKKELTHDAVTLERRSLMDDKAKNGYHLPQASLFSESKPTSPSSVQITEKGLRSEQLDAFRLYKKHKPTSHHHRNTDDVSEELSKLVSSEEFKRTLSIDGDCSDRNVSSRGSTLDEGPIESISAPKYSKEDSIGKESTRQITNILACAGSFPSSYPTTPARALVLPVASTPTKTVRFQLPEDHIDSSSSTTEDEAISEASEEYDNDTFIMWLLRHAGNLVLKHIILGGLLTQVVVVVVAAVFMCWFKGLLNWCGVCGLIMDMLA